MLKQLILNNKSIPVPVPIYTLEEAINWVEGLFGGEDSAVTKVFLDDEELDDERLYLRSSAISLQPSSKLVVKLESHKDLALQMGDAMLILSEIMLDYLKPLAVSCWRIESFVAGMPKDSAKIEDLNNDLQIIIDLLSHLEYLLENGSQLTKLREKSQASLSKLNEARRAKDWRKYAHLLLNELEPIILKITCFYDAA